MNEQLITEHRFHSLKMRLYNKRTNVLCTVRLSEINNNNHNFDERNYNYVLYHFLIVL